MPKNEGQEPDIIPRKIHFIWMGGKIPDEYLKNVRNMAAMCSKMDPPYEVNIWTDQGSRDVNGDDFAKLAKLDGLQIRSIESEILNKVLETDSGYTEQEQVEFLNWILLEYLPPTNYSAVSDLLRYQILVQEGGLYLDTDTVLKEANIKHLKIAFAPGTSIDKKFSIIVQKAAKLQSDLDHLFIKVQKIGGFSCNARNIEGVGILTNCNLLIAANNNANVCFISVPSMNNSLEVKVLYPT